MKLPSGSVAITACCCEPSSADSRFLSGAAAFAGHRDAGQNKGAGRAHIRAGEMAENCHRLPVLKPARCSRSSRAPSASQGETVMTGSRPWYTVLYIQVIIAIVIGIAVGYLFPDTG